MKPEADYIGLIIAAMAGYNPQEAIAALATYVEREGQLQRLAEQSPE